MHVADSGEDGTLLLTALAEATAELPADRIAGAILVTDGEVHDPAALASFPGPVQVLLTGSAKDWDRRVVVETAPAFAIVGRGGEPGAAGRGPGRGAGRPASRRWRSRSTAPSRCASTCR